MDLEIRVKKIWKTSASHFGKVPFVFGPLLEKMIFLKLLQLLKFPGAPCQELVIVWCTCMGKRSPYTFCGRDYLSCAARYTSFRPIPNDVTKML